MLILPPVVLVGIVILIFSKHYEQGHLEPVAIFGDASQTGIGVVAYLIKNDNGVRRSHIFYSKSTLMRHKQIHTPRKYTHVTSL